MVQAERAEYLFSFIYALIFVAVAFKLWSLISKYWNGRYYMKCKQTGVNSCNPNVKTCSSPRCVRCHAYKQLQRDSQRKLEILLSLKETSQVKLLRRVKRAVIDNDRSHEDKLQKPNVLFLSSLKASPFWSSYGSLNNDVYSLEKNFEVIMREFQDKAESTAADALWTCNSTDCGDWQVFHLYNQGCKVQEACDLFCDTHQIIQSLSSFMEGCAFGNALFSIIHPSTVIEEHYGPTNVRIRCHLGLQIPASSKCKLTVAGESRQWHQGSCLLFDDSFLHKAEYVCDNPDNPPRIVFIVDLWHPELSTLEKETLKTLYSL